MQTLKKVLVGLGVVFVLLGVLVAFFAYSFAGFQQQHEAFVRQFVADYSRRWEVADVQAQVTAQFLEQIRSPNGLQAVSYFQRMGRIRSITDVSIDHFTSGTNGKVGVFLFKAEFENAPAVVKVTVIEKDGSVLVQAVNITPVSEPIPSGRGQTDA
jgi:hypothetical protein